MHKIIRGMVWATALAAGCAFGAEIDDSVISEWQGTVTNVHVVGVGGCASLEFDFVLRAAPGSEIRCRMNLPPADRWNGRLYGLGNEGYAGDVESHPMSEGPAIVHCDLGMGRATDRRAHAPSALNDEEWKDFGWRATHLMTVAAKRFCQSYYGQAPHHSYFFGRSTGGGQGLHEAQRFPEDYDGIVAVAPTMGRVALEASLFHRWDSIVWWRRHKVYSDRQLQVLADAAVAFMSDKDEAYCRGKFLSDPRLCEPYEEEIFDLAAEKERIFARGDTRRRFHDIYAGPVVDGARVHHGFPWGATLSCEPGGFCFAAHLKGLPGYEIDPAQARWEDFMAFARARGGDLDALDPDMRAFKARGGKLIVATGFEDPVVPFGAALQHYEECIDLFGTPEEVKAFYRLYLLPGAAHDATGRAFRDFRPASLEQAIVDWVEKGAPVENLVCRVASDEILEVAPYPEKAYREADGSWKRKPALRTVRRTTYNRPSPEPLELALEPDEHWWGGATLLGTRLPFSAERPGRADLRVNHGTGAGGNPAAPLLVSSRGRWVWCEKAFLFEVTNGVLRVASERGAPILSGRAPGGTLADAFRHCAKRFFPPQGMPSEDFFKAPILNTWIELNFHQNQEDVLAYAKSFVDHGMTPGVFMIDCTWQRDFGEWSFRPETFPDPKGMVDQMKAWGYRLMLWTSPMVNSSGVHYKQLLVKDLLMHGDAVDGIMETSCWSGKSAILDCTNPKTRDYYLGYLRKVMDETGVEGFFLDAGDLSDYAAGAKPYDPDATLSDLVFAYHQLGRELPLMQHRASWKTGGWPIMVTLNDKAVTYAAIRQCVADMITTGLIGYPFVVADLVGGGDITGFMGYEWAKPAYNGLPQPPFSAEKRAWMQDLFIRSLEMQCLSPMIQFSASPWRILDDGHQRMVRELMALRKKWTPYILETARASGRTGEPMLRSMEYAYPHCGYARVMDQFLMGDRLLVAPQLDDGATSRTVEIPPGTWRADDGTVTVGPARLVIETPLGRLPHFTREEPGR